MSNVRNQKKPQKYRSGRANAVSSKETKESFSWKNLDWSYVSIALGLLLVCSVIAAFTGLWPWKDNGYNSYALQADAWLHGRLDLGQNYEWLELAIYKDKFFVSFPPFPSYVLLPFAVFMGTHTPDHIIAWVVMLIGAVYAVKLYKALGGEKEQVEFYVLFLYLATGMLFVTINGYVWFIAQNMCFTLSLMSLYYAVKGKGGFSLAFWACAVGCRPMVVLYFPLLVYLLWSQWKQQNPEGTILQMVRRKWYWAIATAIIALSYMILNYCRFGSIVEFGHNYLPEFTRTSTGQFHLSYLKENLQHLIRLPLKGENGGPLQFQTSDGMAFWLAIPLFITILVAWGYALVKRKEKNLLILIMLPVLAILHVLFICCHRTLGGWQFGDRYLLDLLPYLFYGLLLWKPKEEWFVRWNRPLFYGGMALHMIGIVLTYNHWI